MAKRKKRQTTPDGVTFTNQSTLVAVKNGTVIAESFGPDHFSIYDWTPSDVLDQFTARLRELEAANSEGA